MKKSKEFIKIDRRIKTRDYQANLNGIIAYGKTPLTAYLNARKKLNLIKETEIREKLKQTI